MKISLAFYLVFLFVVSGNAQQMPEIIETKNTNMLIPEGIAVHSNGTIYVTSIAQQKIIAIRKDGAHNDFISSGEYGFGMGVGIKLDERRNRLWVVSDKKEGKWTLAQAHVFTISDRKLVKTFTVKDTINHFFNDLCIDKDGNAWITATESGEIYFVSEKLDGIQLAVRDTLLKYPNGIAFSKNKLYIATYGSGLLLYDLSTKKLSQLRGFTTRTYAYSFDGLDFWGDKLYGVYNGAKKNSDNAVVEYMLDEKAERIVSETVFAKGHAAFYEPTTLAILANKLYLLANSHLGYYNENKESVTGIEDKLKPVTVLIYDLKK